MTGTIDLNAEARKYIENKRGRTSEVKELNFGRLKLKIVSMNTSNYPIEDNSLVRIVKMENNASESGMGQFTIEKEGKPVFTLKLNTVVKGYPHRVEFKLDSGSFFAPVDQEERTIEDYTGIRMETIVPLPSGTTSRAKVSNEKQTFTEEFSGQAHLTGLIGATLNDSVDTHLEFDVGKLGFSTFSLSGSINYFFQNTHNITVE